MPKISILIPVYNNAPFVTKCLESLYTQTFKDFEIICVNDGSTDDSLLKLEQFQSKDTRIQIYSHKKSLGQQQALQTAFNHSISPYIFSLDSDDWISEDALENMYSKITSANASACLLDMCFIYPNGSIDKIISGVHGDPNIELSNLKAFELSLDWTIHGMGLWDRDVYKIAFDANGYKNELITRKRFIHCTKVVFSKGTYFYLQNNKSITRSNLMRKFYYLEIDNGIVDLIHTFPISKTSRTKFEYDRSRRIIQKHFLFFKEKKELTSLQQTSINKLLERTFQTIDSRLFISLFSSKKKIILEKLIWKNYYLFKLYCYAKSKK